jgi:rhamnosyltransferase
MAEAEIIHLHNETPRGVFNRYKREGMAFKSIYPEAHFSLYDLVRMVSSNIGFDLLHAVRERVLWRSFASILWFRWMQFWGTYQGYRHSGLLTPELRQTFYYPLGWQKPKFEARDVKPIQYNE